jgi:N utilization substance protein B
LISRRNIRVKVMQTLYSIESEALPPDADRAQESLSNKLEQTSRLFHYLLYLISEVARYAETDALKRASKHLPSQEDLNVNIKVSGNSLLWQYYEDPAFQKEVKDGHFESRLDPAIVRRLYLALTATREYTAYISEPSRDRNGERAMLVFILNSIILPDERVDEHLTEQFMVWDDDAEMMQTMIVNFLNRPAAWSLGEVISEEKRQFGETLLRTAIEKKEHCLEVIGAKLKNWDPDRIAVLDMVLMRMGLCELLYFETIPAKVTINEYIDLAKDYSTPQSGQFVNGILDGIHKEMETEGRLRKVEYRK